MCGIFFTLSQKSFILPSSEDLLRLMRRGPDFCKTVQRRIQSKSGITVLHLSICASVLSLRGDGIIEQPLEDPASGSVFAWNGEGWKFDGHTIGGNDAAKVFCMLLDATQSASGSAESCKAEKLPHKLVVDVIRSITGPYAFVFFDAVHGDVYFARDCLGRRSLLWTTGQDGSLIFSSLANGSNISTWNDVDADGVYMFAIRDQLDRRPETRHANNEFEGSERTPWSDDESMIVSRRFPVRFIFCNPLH